MIESTTGELWAAAGGVAKLTVRAVGQGEALRLLKLLLSTDDPGLRNVQAHLIWRANRCLAGRAILAQLRDEGGPDLLEEIIQYAVEAPGVEVAPHDSLTTARFTRSVIGGVLLWRTNCGPWLSLSDEEAAAQDPARRSS